MNGSIETRKLPVLYRYDTSGSGTSSVALFLHKYQALKETTQGWWIEVWDHKERERKWVSKTARKRYAYETKELALNSYINRKKRMIAHLSNTLTVTQTAVELAMLIREGKKTDNDSLPNPAYVVSHSFEWEY